MDYDEVGALSDLEDYDEVGARRNKRRGIKIRADYSSGKYRVLPLPFVSLVLAGAGSGTLTATADRPCKPVRLIMTTTAGVVTITALTCQGQNMLAGAGAIPIDTFSNTAEADDLPWDYSPLEAGGTMVISATGSAAATVSAAAKVLVAR